MTSEILKVKKRFNYPPDLEETPLVNFFNLRNSNTKIDKYLLALEDEAKDYFEEQDVNGVDMCYADQEPRRARRVDYSALANGNL